MTAAGHRGPLDGGGVRQQGLPRLSAYRSPQGAWAVQPELPAPQVPEQRRDGWDLEQPGDGVVAHEARAAGA